MTKIACDFAVLLVEDDPVAEKVAALNFRALGISIDTVNSGQRALARISTKRYDLILMDVGLPDVDGYALTEKIRAHDHLSAPPIIGLSAHIDEEHRARCREVGMYAVFAKPLTSIVVKNILDSLNLSYV